MGISVLKPLLRRLVISAAVFGLAISATTHAAQAQSLYLIAHPGVKLSPRQIEDAFLGDLEFTGDTRLVLFDNQQAHQLFTSKVLTIEAKRYHTLWIKKSFREALTPPTMKRSDVEVLQLIKNTPGAIGYTTSIATDVLVIKEY
jgi:hypothetical protein